MEHPEDAADGRWIVCKKSILASGGNSQPLQADVHENQLQGVSFLRRARDLQEKIKS